MNKNKTLLYIAIFAALLVAAYFITTDRGEKTASYDLDEETIFDADSALIDKIQINGNNGNITLVKSGGEWRLSEPVDARVNTKLIESALSNLSRFELESIVSSNPDKHANYGFTEDNQATITVYQNGEMKGSFIIGNAGPGTGQAYLRKTGSDDVYLASDLVRSNLIKSSADDWRDKNIVSIPQETVQSVEFITGGESFTASRDTTGNFVIGSDPVSSDFNGILSSLQNFNTQNFKDTALAADTDFDYRMLVNWGPVTELKFLKLQSEPVQYLLQVSDNPQIYLLDEGSVKNLIKDRSQLVSK